MILPGDWGAKPGLEQGSVDEEDEKEHAKTLPFELKLTFFTSIVLFYPVVLSLLIGTKPSVLYWCGRWSIFACVATIIWVMLCHFMFSLKALRPGLAPVGYLIVPSVWIFIICEIQVRVISGQGAILMSEDCNTFQSKAKVERAWWAAQQLLEGCAAELTSSTGANINETMNLLNLRECRGYEEGLQMYSKEWKYIEGVEKEHRCGGCVPCKPRSGRFTAAWLIAAPWRWLTP